MVRIGEKALRDRLVSQLLPRLEAQQRSRAEELLTALARDWALEAGDDETSAETLRILQAELDARLAGRNAAEQLEVLEAEVLDRELRKLSRESFELGRQLIAGEVEQQAATAQGMALLAAAEALGPRIQALGDPARRLPLETEQQNVVLEALFAVEQKAMSGRLSRFAADRSGGDLPPPRIKH